MQKNYNIISEYQKVSSVYIFLSSQLFLFFFFAVWNCLIYLSNTLRLVGYLTCLDKYSTFWGECNKEIHSDALSFSTEKAAGRTLVCKGISMIALKCTLTLDSRELHNLIWRVLLYFIMIYGHSHLIHVMLSYRKHSLAHDDAVSGLFPIYHWQPALLFISAFS